MALPLLALTAAVAITTRASGAMPPIPIETRPGAVPVSKADAEKLGATLFFDGRLGKDGRRTCSGCHLPEFGWTDREPKSLGVYGRRARRNSPTLLGVKNVEAKGVLFRDGRVANLVDFVVNPLTDHNELDNSPATLVERISAAKGYRPLFQKAYGTTEVTFGRIETAIALFNRTLEFKPSRFSRFQGGDRTALSDVERKGYELFSGRLGCTACHSGARLTDDDFHATGTGRQEALGGSGDSGRGAISKRSEDNGAFRTPSLLNVSVTPPYFHDGSAHTLEDVIDFYETKMPDGVRVDPRRPVITLTSDERDQLLTFLKSLDATDGGFKPPEVPAE